MKTKLIIFLFLCFFAINVASALETSQLTEETSLIGFPYWSSDGEKIVYLSFDVYDAEVDMQVWIMDENGRNKNKLLNKNEICGFTSDNPLSPDGSLLLYISNVTGNRELWAAETDGLKKRQLTEGAHLENYAPTLVSWKASWSPDGSQIVYVSATSENKNLWKIVENGDGEKVLMYDIKNVSKDCDIWVIDSDGTDNSRLTDDGKSNCNPMWRPDGEKIAFVSNVSGNGGIWGMNKDGSDKIQLVDSYAHNTAWSPDGTKIAYVKTDNENYTSNMWIMDSDGTNKTQLTNNSNYMTYQFYPEWSPDGTKIVSTLAEQGRYGIWIMNSDGTAPIRIGEGLMPQWSPKGDKIAYTDIKGDNSSISVISLDEELASAPSETLTSEPVMSMPEATPEKTSGFGAFIVVLSMSMIFRSMKKTE